jgi:2-phosphosulfolactate phosphatase
MFAIECFLGDVPGPRPDCGVVAVDVLRSTTTAVTGAMMGRRCFPVATLEQASAVAAETHRPLLVGELGGYMPYGFDITNSPVDLSHRSDLERPMILLSTSGTPLICRAMQHNRTYAACLRNYTAQVRWLAAHHRSVVLVGAGTRGEFRREDELACAWMGEALIDAGFEPEPGPTREIVERWSGSPVEAIGEGRSAEYLRRTGQEKDLHFVLAHVDDVDTPYVLRKGEVVAAREQELRLEAPGGSTSTEYTG